MKDEARTKAELLVEIELAVEAARMQRQLKTLSAKTYAGKIRDTARLFQKVIRFEAADSAGMVQCASCGQSAAWNDCDAGHFHSRRNTSTVFQEATDEIAGNCHPQCKSCNRFPGTNTAMGYIKFMSETYSADQLKALEERKFEDRKFTDIELAKMRIGYLDRLK